MEDSGDRFGKKLDEKRKGEEDHYFQEQEQQAIEKLRQVKAGTATPQAICPRCGAALVHAKHFGVELDECPNGHGMWLEQGELEVIAAREKDSWLGRYFFKPRLED